MPEKDKYRYDQEHKAKDPMQKADRKQEEETVKSEKLRFKNADEIYED